MIAQLLLSIVIIAAALAAILYPRLVRAAVALAVGNTAVALFFLSRQANAAGVVQLSVGVGVLSALFLVAISLTERLRKG